MTEVVRKCITDKDWGNKLANVVESTSNPGVFGLVALWADGSWLGESFLKLDQTTPQSVTGGQPIFEDWLKIWTATDEGQLSWNTDDDCLDVTTSGGNVTIQVWQETMYDVINQTGGDLTDGRVVMFTGTLWASGKITVDYGIADSSVPAVYNIGITTETIANWEAGKVTQFGKVRWIDTTWTPFWEVWNDGDVLYVSPDTAGYLTKTQPQAPDLTIPIAAVIKAHASTGTLLVRPTYWQKMTDLDDVNGTPMTTNGQIMVWDNDNWYFDANYNINDVGINFSYENIQAALTIPLYQQMIVMDDMIVEEELIVEWTLIREV